MQPLLPSTNEQDSTSTTLLAHVKKAVYSWAWRPQEPLEDSLLESVYLLLVGLTPLLFSPLTNELFEFPKMVWVYGLTLLAIGLHLVSIFGHKNVSWSSTPLNRYIALYLVVVLLATLLSIDPYTSIMGYYSRFNGGLASLLCYIILFYLGLPLFKNPLKRLHLLWCWIISSSLVSIWAILEHFGTDPSCYILRGTWSSNCWVQDVQARVFATFGQPNWLATYLLTALPLSLALLLTAHTSRAKWTAWTIAILNFAAFWYTFSRSGWFGLVAALLFLALFLPLNILVQHKRWLGSLLLMCLLISLSSLQLASSRTASSLSSGGEDSSTGQLRLLVWQGSLELIKAHPLLGTGPETFAYAFLPYRPRAMNDTTEWNFLYNKAHNDILQTAAGTGLLGLIAWLALFVGLALFLWRQHLLINLQNLLSNLCTGLQSLHHSKSNKASQPLMINPKLTVAQKTQATAGEHWVKILRATAVAKLCHSAPERLPSEADQLSDSDQHSILNPTRQATAATHLVGWAPAHSVEMHNERLPAETGITLPNHNQQPTAQTTIHTLALAAGILGVFVSQLLGFSVVITNLYFWLALCLILAPSSTTQHYLLTPFLRHIYLFISSVLLSLATLWIFLYTTAEITATQAATSLDAGDSATALTSFAHILTLNPWEPTYHKNVAQAATDVALSYSGKDADPFVTLAQDEAQRAYALNPNNLLTTKGLVALYQQLGATSSKFNDLALAMAQKSLQLAPTDAAAAQQLADLNLELNNKEAALNSFDTLVALRPKSPESYLHRAKYFKKYGPTDSYRQDLSTVLKLDPQNKDAQTQLQKLTDSRTQ